MPFKRGDYVTWNDHDEEIPEGTVGFITFAFPDDVLNVIFPSRRGDEPLAYSFSSSDLMLAEAPFKPIYKKLYHRRRSSINETISSIQKPIHSAWLAVVSSFDSYSFGIVMCFLIRLVMNMLNDSYGRSRATYNTFNYVIWTLTLIVSVYSWGALKNFDGTTAESGYLRRVFRAMS